ncbi:MAG: hypothetical protein JXM71_11820, partial [Spirochaetales bacterium]|nr:hypothetical protein [Spirochaetales bacterium]
MKRNALMLVVLLSAARATPSGALDWSYSLSGGAGAAMALGGDLDAALAEFGASVSADAAYAPVAAVSVGAGAAVRLKGSLVGTASLDVRRMGYAFWAADVGAVSWLSMWTAGVGA